MSNSPFNKRRQPMNAVSYLGKNLELWSATFMPCEMLLCGESSEFYWTGWLLLHSWSPTFKFIERAGQRFNLFVAEDVKVCGKLKGISWTIHFSYNIVRRV